jgi:hypothetical protein
MVAVREQPLQREREREREKVKKTFRKTLKTQPPERK